MSTITTHVLDTVFGKPAAGVAVRLQQLVEGRWVSVSTGATDADGRCRDLADSAAAGAYQLSFDTGAYFESQNRNSIYTWISITFTCDGEAHYHLPLLLSDNSYTTYRGS